MQLILVLIIMIIPMGYFVKRKDDFGQWRNIGEAGESSSRPSKLRSSIGQQQDADQYPGLSNCECGRANSLGQTRIIGGKNTLPHQYPFLAFAFRQIGEDLFRFSATILTVWHLLTAAHCTFGVSADNITVFVGVHNVSNPNEPSVQMLFIANNTQYPNFNNQTPYFLDISILVTKTKINFTPNVGPACLPSRFFSLEGQQLKVMGWGETETGNSVVLREADLYFVSYTICKRFWDEIVDLSHICTFKYGKSVCNGDSGGGVFYYNTIVRRYTQVGIISYGPLDCFSKPSLNIDLTIYKNWIGRIIAETKPGVTACLGA